MKLAQRVQQLAASATLAVSAKAASMKRDGIDVVSFAAGEPDFDTPDSIKHACIEAIKQGRTGYGKPASGLPEAKEAVCTKLARDNGLSYLPEQVLITSGGKMAVYLAMQALLDPGDEVLILKPYWVSYPEIVKLAGGVPVFLEASTDDFKVSPDAIRAALSSRVRALIFNSPSNPSGVTYSPEEVRAIAGALADHDVWVISDEIYDQLTYDGLTALSYGAVSERSMAQTVTLNSASKTFAMTGWRLGYAAGPVPVIGAMAKLQSQMTSGAVTFNQFGLIAALTSQGDELESMRREFDRRRLCMYERLNTMSAVRCIKPTGAFYCFPNVCAAYEKLGVGGSLEFAERLIEEARVAVVPGIAFGMDEHVRLSFATGIERIHEGLERIERFLG